MTLWEIDRYSWANLRAAQSAELVPIALVNLANAPTEEEAVKWYWQIDNVVIVQGGLYEAAIPTVTCVILALPFATVPGRGLMLELLSQIANGYWSADELSYAPPDWPLRCRQELLKGVPYFLGILPLSSSTELEWCADLLSICAQWNTDIVPVVIWYFERLLKTDISPSLRNFIEQRLAALMSIH